MTPCNLSPCIIGPMASATPPSFMTPEDTAIQPHSSLEDIDPTWRTHFQLLVTEGGPSQLVSSLHYLPKLFRVIFCIHVVEEVIQSSTRLFFFFFIPVC